LRQQAEAPHRGEELLGDDLAAETLEQAPEFRSCWACE
jgi:hypothetical protein